jgi:hypothetical protein
MVTTIDGIEAVRSVCLYSSGISYAIVKTVSHQILCGGHGLPELCKSFLALPESGSSLLLLLFFRESFARLISVSSVRPATLSHWNTDACIYARMVYVQGGASLRPPVFSRSGKKSLPPSYSRLRVPRVAPPSNPLLQLTFCGTRLRSTGQFRVYFPSLPDRFCACDGVWPVRRETTRGEI